MKLLRRQFLHLAAGVAALPAALQFAWAQAYPTQPVRVIVGFPAGQAADSLARIVAQALSQRLGQQFIVDNRPGAGGNIGTDVIVRSAPDGYTILMEVMTSNAINASLYPDLNFNFIRDIAPVAIIGGAAYVVAVNPSVPANTLPEFIAYAKAHPGKINWSSAGLNSNPHVALEMFKAATGIDVLHIPYKGQGPALTDLVAGQVDVTYASLLSSESYFKSGRVKILGISGPRRQTVIPNIPTFTEQGVPAADSILWFGLVTAAGTPRAVVRKLNDGVNKALQMPDVRKRFEQLGVLIEGGTPEKFGAFIRSEAKHMEPLIKSGALRAE